MCDACEGQARTRERGLVQFEKDLSPHLKLLIQNGIGGLVPGHRCGRLPFMENVSHASLHANCRAPEATCQMCCGENLCSL